MSLFELFWIGQRSDRRGLRLPLLLAILITKCGSSSFPNRTKEPEINHIISGASTTSTSSSSTPIFSIKHVDGDYQDFPLEYHKFQSKSSNFHHIEEQYYGENVSSQNVKTLGYFLKGLILPMLISLTLSFGFIIYKNRVKRARLQAIQTALEEARTNPNQIPPSSYRHHEFSVQGHANNGFVSNALLSFIDARGEWSLITGNESSLLESDDYMGEGGETARHKPYIHDQPPAYATVFDPPTYEEAVTSLQPKKAVAVVDNGEMCPPLPCSSAFPEMEDDYDDEGKHLMSADFQQAH